MVKTLKTTQKTEQSRGNAPELFMRRPFHTSDLFSLFSCFHPSWWVVPCISRTPMPQMKTTFGWIEIIQVVSQLSCLSALLTPLFFLVLLGLVKRSLWDPLIRALRVLVWLPRLVWISSGCGSAVVRRSSRSLRGFGASLPVARSHPTLVRYKASYPLFISNLSCYRCSSVSYLVSSVATILYYLVHRPTAVKIGTS
jgi:hypothetical protein